MSAPFTPGLPPAGASSAFIGRDAHGNVYLLRWHETNGWEALGWVGAGKAAMPALRHPAGQDQGLIVGHARAPGVAMAADDWSYAFDGSTLRDRFGGSFMASEPDANGNVSVLISQADAHAIVAALGKPGAEDVELAVLHLRQQLERRMQAAVVNADCMNVPVDEVLSDATLAVRYAELSTLLAGQEAGQ
ncbi:hypothetical protein SAMN04515666_11953 [Bosea lupini]|uniref:Uncharacterized protein n=1 Tax=Bosea lupini TaxID=1036779 RepID=A0A1H8AGD0_9HYPH|nr:hypothetical protein [Bosea lupini]SEM69872.1 hypothetical protein SAMN04515666_11953 [Bosea lupini]